MNTKTLQNLQIDTLNEMQEVTIASVKKNDIILISPTGSGKTLAFLFPILERLKKEENGIQALILAPSRELAQQIEQVWRKMQTGYKANCFYGGHSTRIEKSSLTHPPALLVGTPGRIAYHIRNGNFDTRSIHTLVLDEFDKSLELGFHDEMSFIIDHLENVNRRLLTSATSLEDIPGFTQLNQDAIRIDFLKAVEHKPDLTIKAVSTLAADKAETLFSLLCYIGNKSSLVFCNHREAVNRISDLLHESAISHAVFHGGMDQDERERALLQFRNGSRPILVCTDLAARGLDIPDIDCIVHYQLPNEETFIHRNGRSARMQAKGTVYLILHDGKYPDYLKKQPEMISLPETDVLPSASPWCTLYIGAGKKDKVNKVDIVGLLIKKGKIKMEDLGLIEVFDHSAYVAVKNNRVKQLLLLIADERLKNKKVKIELIN